MPEEKVHASGDLWMCREHAVRERSSVECQIIALSDAPRIEMRRARKLEKKYGRTDEFITMKVDFLGSTTMAKYLHEQLVVRRGFADYEISDVGFWDFDVSTDTGFGWHNDNNWNNLLRPDHRSYHGWFVNTCTEDCNSTLAVSTDYRYNECNTNEAIGITDIRDNDVIKPDVVVPLTRSTLVLFPVGAAHRTHRFKPPDALVGRRLCTTFILHRREDGLNEAKLDTLTDDEIRSLVKRYPIEKLFETGHYLVRLLESNSRTAPLVRELLASLVDA